MKKSEALRREKMITARVSRREKEIVQQAARQRNQTVCAMLIELAMDAAAKAGVFAQKPHPGRIRETDRLL